MIKYILWPTTVGIPYFDSEECIEINVPDKHMKLEHSNRANIMKTMKNKINELGCHNAELTSKLTGKSKLNQINDVMSETNITKRKIVYILWMIVWSIR